MAKRSIKSKGNVLFYVFMTLAIIIFLSPIIIKIELLRKVISWYMFELGIYKSDFVGLIGGMIGTGLAVSGALWMQNKSSLESKVEQEIHSIRNQLTKCREFDRYLDREMKRLWTLWLWSNFDISIYLNENKELPYEPYPLETSNLYTNFISIENDLDDEVKDLFYSLYHFSEKVNEYIKSYNHLKTDSYRLDSNSINVSSISISSEIVASKSASKVINLIRMLIESKEEFLFSKDYIGIDNVLETMINHNRMDKKIRNEIESLAKKIHNNGKSFIDYSIYNSYNDEKNLIKDWVEGKQLEQLPEEFREIINDLSVKIDDALSYQEKHEINKIVYLDKMDSPPLSTKILKMKEEIKVLETTLKNSMETLKNVV